VKRPSQSPTAFSALSGPSHRDVQEKFLRTSARKTSSLIGSADDDCMSVSTAPDPRVAGLAYALFVGCCSAGLSTNPSCWSKEGAGHRISCPTSN
jgi:hypothetical protein